MRKSHINLPPLSGLQAFDAICRTGNVTKAAEMLCVSPSAISHRLRSLETSLGVKLFDRLPDGLKLTATGETLRKPIGQGFGNLEQAIHLIENEIKSSDFIVGCLPSFTICWLLPRLSQWNAQKQGFDLRIETITEEDHIRLGTDFDAIIDVGSRGLTTHPNSEFLMTDESGPIMTPNLAAKINNDPKSLEKLNFYRPLSRPSILEKWIISFDGTISLQPKIREFEHLHMCIEAARGGNGFAIAPKLYVQSDIESKKLIAPFGFSKKKDGYFIATSQNKTKDQRTRKFVKWLQTVK